MVAGLFWWLGESAVTHRASIPATAHGYSEEMTATAAPSFNLVVMAQAAASRGTSLSIHQASPLLQPLLVSKIGGESAAIEVGCTGDSDRCLAQKPGFFTKSR